MGFNDFHPWVIGSQISAEELVCTIFPSPGRERKDKRENFSYS